MCQISIVTRDSVSVTCQEMLVLRVKQCHYHVSSQYHCHVLVSRDLYSIHSQFLLILYVQFSLSFVPL